MSELCPLSEIDMANADPLELGRQFNALRAKQIEANENGTDGLTAAESRYAIQLTRILRRTNTGPKKARAASTRVTKKALSKETLDKLFDDLP